DGTPLIAMRSPPIQLSATPTASGPGTRRGRRACTPRSRSMQVLRCHRNTDRMRPVAGPARWAGHTGTVGGGPGHGLTLVPAAPGHGSPQGLPAARPADRAGAEGNTGADVMVCR